MANGQPVPTAQTVPALVDTGASLTCVDPEVLTALELSPTGSIPVHTPSSGDDPEQMDVFDVSLQIWCGAGDPPLERRIIPVVGSKLKVQGIQALIGRDVLSDCLLVYNGTTSMFTLAF